MSTQTATDSRSDETPAPAYRTVQRVIFPADRDLDVLPLYIDQEVEASEGVYIHPDDVLSRRSIKVRAGERLSFGSYFNAFPASYWRRWTIATSVRLTVRTTGDGALVVYRSNARGDRQRVDAEQIDGSATTTVDLTLAPFGDGGWYWFDLIAGNDGVVLESAEWSVPEEGSRAGRVSLAVTTFNRPDYCANLVRAVAADHDVRAVLDEMLVVDQGNQKVVDQPDFDAVAADMGAQLRIIDQPNLGGSGGFSRGMYEAVKAERSDYVLLLDDDIILETEGVLRLVTFADFTRKPTIVGGHMFDMFNRSVLHTFGEIVLPWRFQPGHPADDMELGHNFNEDGGLRETEWLHRRVDVDYNGWWMCLIPTSVVRELGLAMPVFIKWDDSEYGLRARDAGVPTVTLPGAAVWHVSWADKDDLVGWQAYFHERNRVITALMYSQYERGGRVLRESTYMDVKHLISMQYYTQRGRLMAMQDILRGPDAFHELLPTRLGDVRALASDYPDAQISKEVEAFPETRRRRPPPRGREASAPHRVMLAPLAFKAVARQFLKPVDPVTREHPEALVPHHRNKWWNLAQFDSAVVSTADGTGASWYQRDPRLLRSMMAAGLKLHTELLVEWPRLRKAYREALPRITSFEAWERTFGLSDDDKR